MADSKHAHGHGHGHGSMQKSPSDLMQMKTRKERGFSGTEADLPSISQHTSFKLSNPLTARAAAGSKLSDILSYLGPYNPLPVPVAPTDSVWMLDNTAYRGAKGTWEAEFVTAVFSQHASCTVMDVVLQVADKLDLTDEADEQAALAKIEQRLMPFLWDIQPGRQVKAVHGGQKLTFSPGGRNGISSDVRAVPEAPAGYVVPTTAEVPKGTDGILEAKTFFSAPDGWAVISGW
jgi:hypothetical protein